MEKERRWRRRRKKNWMNFHINFIRTHSPQFIVPTMLLRWKIRKKKWDRHTRKKKMRRKMKKNLGMKKWFRSHFFFPLTTQTHFIRKSIVMMTFSSFYVCKNFFLATFLAFCFFCCSAACTQVHKCIRIACIYFVLLSLSLFSVSRFGHIFATHLEWQ